jgi:hypothetical protein
MRKQRNRPIEEKEGWSSRLVDGQWSPTSSINGLMGPTDRLMVN